MTPEEIRQIVAEELSKALKPLLDNVKVYMTTEEKAKQLGIKEDTLRRMARRGEIDCIKAGHGPKARLRFT